MNRTVTITVDEDGSLVSASVAELPLEAATMVIKRANAEALKLLELRARRRHFRRPVTYRSFNDKGDLILKHDATGWTWGVDNPERGEPGTLTFEDSRGRKASVRVDIVFQSAGTRRGSNRR
ncbi:MAG: hypothetical protein ABR973_12435 [Candidatus Acidiferrales bacterium]|jgi:hypothetical protein